MEYKITNNNETSCTCGYWDNYHLQQGPYDGRPWHGVIPPPTYEEFETYQSTTINFEGLVPYMGSVRVNNGDESVIVSPQKIYDRNKELEIEVKLLKEQLVCWENMYRGKNPSKPRYDLNEIIEKLTSVRDDLKDRGL